MISEELNNLLVRVGAGTACGQLMREYWQPVALLDELEGPRPVRAVRVLGEDLVLFRSPQNGELCLVDRQCPHRGADLAFGRLEDGGLRCPFHGWLFDGTGRCLEQPAEPEDSRSHEGIRQTSYPVVERAGIVFAYMGALEPPSFPAFDCFTAPDSHVFAFKGFIDCNWLQALEVGIDPAHASFLHRYLEDEDVAGHYGQQFRDAAGDTQIPITGVLRADPRPRINVEETDYGMRIVSLRTIDAERAHVRVTNQIFPHAIAIPMSREMMITQWHVPIDDVRTYWYAIFTSFGEPVDKAAMRAQRLKLYTLPDYMPRAGRSNDYNYDPQEQAEKTYLGMGTDINVHDQWAVESMGAIQDRTKEHLARSDVAIIRYRAMLRKALAGLAEGDASSLPFRKGAGTGPIAVDAIGSHDGAPDAAYRAADEARRQRCEWSRRGRGAA